MLPDEFASNDDYIVTEIAVSLTSGYQRVTTYGPYIRNRAVRVRDWYRKNPPRENWKYTYTMTRMVRDRMEAA